jgi:phosphoribosylformimino-5-aminoimidazole carboxamide ribotide isomerase
MIVIPAIDILENRIVRLRKGEFNEVEYYRNTPLEQAKIFSEYGFEWLHLVDLLGSKSGIISVKEIIRQIKTETGLKIEFGGGIRSISNIEEILSLGVDKIIIGSLSVQNKTEFENIIIKFGPGRFVIAADVKEENIVIKGWTVKTSVTIFEHIDYCISLGLNTFLCTDVSKDGMLSGTNINLYKKILEKEPGIKLIASGGIKNLEDVIAVNEINVFGAVVGKAIYENKIDLKELAKVGK